MAELDFRLLGPLSISANGTTVRLSGAKQRALLAALLLRANRRVSRDVLIEALWPATPPATAAHALEVHVSRARKALEAVGAGERLRTAEGAYVLDVRRGELDLERFEQITHEGREALAGGDAAGAVRLLTGALALWRDEPLLELVDDLQARIEADRLRGLRLEAFEVRFEAMLALGEHAAAVPELQAFVDANPLRERARAQLMLALYRSGRQAEALDAYQQARRTLVDELGVEPSEELRELQKAILRQDGALAALGPASGGARRLGERASVPTESARAAAVSSRVPGGWALVVAGAAVLLAAVVAGILVTRGGPETVSGLTGNSVGRIDPETGTIAAEVPTDAAPTRIAAGAGSLWVTHSSAGTVSRIDSRAGQVRQEVPVGRHPTGIAFGNGAAWVANNGDGTISRIDAEAERVVQTIDVGNGPTAVAFGSSAVWVTNVGDSTISKLDAHSGKVLATIETEAAARGVAVGGGAIWVTNEWGRSVLRLDLRAGRVTDAINVGNGPTALTVGAGGVWVANTLDGTVSRIDPARRSITATIPVGDGPNGVSVGAGGVWVTNESGASIARIDPATNRVDETIRLGSRPVAVAVADGAVWAPVQPSEIAHRGGTLVVYSNRPFDSADPAFSYDALSATALILVHDGLTALKRVDGSDGTQVVPNLAVSLPSPTNGGTTYTFQLRPGIRYSTGLPVKASDFRHGLERVFRLNSPGASHFIRVEGGARCMREPTRCDLSRGVVTDDQARTVTFHLTAPDPEFLYKLTLQFASAVPGRTPPAARALPPGTGPYQIARYNPREDVRLVRNPHFREWSKAAQPAGYPDEIVWRIGADTGDAITAIARGDGDVSLDNPPPERLEEVLTQYASRVHVSPVAGTWFASFNTSLPPFDDVRVRRALNYAIDRAAIARLQGRAELAPPTCQVLPPNFTAYRPYCPYTRSPAPDGRWNGPHLAKARQLVAASGSAGMKVTLWSGRTTPPLPRETRYVLALLRRIGYRASLRIVDDQAYLAALADPRKVQIGMLGWYADYPAPSNFMSLLRCGGLGTPRFCDRGIDSEIDRALEKQSADPQAANELWQKVERRIVDQAPWLTLFTPTTINFVSSRVSNYQYHPQYGVLLSQLWVR